MAGKIQNEDIKSVSDLTGAGGSAAQLPNDDKIFVTANALNKTLKQAIIDGDLSGGSGTQQALWSGGFHGGSGSDYWVANSTSEIDYTITGTLALTEVYNDGMGTVTAAASSRPGVTFVAPYTGVMEIKAQATVTGSGGTHDRTYYLTDGSNNHLDSASIYASSASYSNVGDIISLVGFLDVVAGNTYTVKLRAKSTTASDHWIGPGPTDILEFNLSYAASSALTEAYDAKTANYTLSYGDAVVTGSASGGAFAFTLPTAVGHMGKRFNLMKTDGSTNAISLLTTSSQTIGGRASNDVKLRQLGDYIEVVSDNANWQIVNKKETQNLQSSGSESFVNIGTAGNYGNIATSVALTYGVWELDANFVLACSTGIAPSILGNSGFYAANGANSASQPTQLGSEVIAGTPLYTDLGAPIVYNNTINPGNNSRWSSHHNKITVSITANQTIYLVPQTDFSTAGGTAVHGKIQAKRIW